VEKTVADFFAGIGLVRLALERVGWSEMYALDYSDEKRAIYEAQFGKGVYHVEDVHNVLANEVPNITLAHASFPCTDTSVAGGRKGLLGKESSAFWGFIDVLRNMGDRRPPIVLLENVEGFLTSRKGEDLRNALKALCDLNYAVDLMSIDAAHFVPQSRVRLFIVGSQSPVEQDQLEQEMILQQATEARSKKLVKFIRTHPDVRWQLRELPPLPKRTVQLSDIIDYSESWWSRDRSDYLYHQMHQHHKARVHQMMQGADWSYGTVFRRMRYREGKMQSTAELRTDGIAGCLRTPKGGSARQILFRAGKGTFDARLLNGRECARLMGADSYHLDQGLSLNQVLYGFGDAVCVPVIEWIAKTYLNPLVEGLARIASEDLRQHPQIMAY
jgi:DNA (cytosine-5)-methyltransferase 1